MQAILLALGHRTSEPFEWTDTPPALRPVLDRPLVHHVVEALVDRGVTRLLAVTDGDAGWLANALGDGARWGCQVTHVTVEDEARAVSALRDAALASSDPLVAVAAADRLPLRGAVGSTAGELIVVDGDRGGNPPAWGEFAVLPPQDLAGAARVSSVASLGDELVALGVARGICVASEAWLDARSASELLGSNRRALDSRQRGLLSSGREVEPGVWVGRNVRLGPGARLVAPVFIGENSSIGAGCTVGPHASVGSSCLIDANAVLSRAMVTAGTYVGEGLDVLDTIVDGPVLVNVRLGASVRIDDGLLLAGARRNSQARGVSSR
jgi:NDP-sugar pyrophosphorylase family protein